MNDSQTTAREQQQSPARSRELAIAEIAVRIPTQQGMAMLVDGDAGMGKTYFLRNLVEAAVQLKQLQVSFVRADEIERGEPYSFIERLVAASLISGWNFVPDDETTPVALARECVQRLIPYEESPGRLIVLDDAHWIDAESQRVLRYLLPRVIRRRVTLAFGVRTPHTRDSFGEFLTQFVEDSPLDEHYRLEPFTLPEITAHALDRLGVGISSTTAQRMLVESGGSFLGIESVLATLTGTEISQLHLAWDPPGPSVESFDERLLHQFDQMSPAAQRATELVCLAGHEITPNDLQAAGRALGEPLALEESISAGVLTKSGVGSSIIPRHALVADAVSATISSERTRVMYRALAGVTTGYRSLRHTLLGAEDWNDDLRQSVAQFVLEALRKNTPELASDIIRAALELDTDTASRAELLESLTLVHMRAKTGYLMLDLLPELEALPHSALHEFMAIVIAAHQVGEQLPMERVQRLLMTPPQNEDDAAVLGFFAFMVVILTMRSEHRESVPGLIALAKSLIAQGPNDESELADLRLGWMVDRAGYLLVLDAYLMVQDQFLANMDRVNSALPELTRRINNLPDSSLKVDASIAVAGAKLAAGDVEGGRALAQQGVDLLDRVSEPWAASTARLILADSMVLHGSYDEASELMQLTEELSYTALDVETRSTWAALRVFIAAAKGHEHASSSMEQARRYTEFSWEGYGADLPIIAECELGRARGDHAAVLAITSDELTGQVVNTRHGFLTYRAHSLIAEGRLDEASDLIDQLASWRGVRWHECWGTIDWLRARLAQARHDGSAAKWHYEAAIEQREFLLPYALTLAHYGEFLLQQGDETTAAEMLERSRGVLETLGAGGYVAWVRDLLQKVAPSSLPAPKRAHLLETLTAREQQIVAHLVKGRSNNQIADALVVSVTTVRSHVSNLLRKLQLSTRGEVARLFRDSAEHSTVEDRSRS